MRRILTTPGMGVKPIWLNHASRKTHGPGSSSTARMPEGPMRFAEYQAGDFFDEMFDGDGARPFARALAQFVDGLPDGELARRQRSAERALLNMGITFGVYGDGAGSERIFPFDLVPRIVPAHDWRQIERGLKQRIQALN